MLEDCLIERDSLGKREKKVWEFHNPQNTSNFLPL